MLCVFLMYIVMILMNYDEITMQIDVHYVIDFRIQCSNIHLQYLKFGFCILHLKIRFQSLTWL